MSDAPESYRGKVATLHFEGSRCIHSRNCVLGRPEVFRANVEGPSIDPDAVPVAQLTEAAHACPSGAITYTRADGGPEESAPSVNVIRVLENGPLAVRAELRITGETPRLRATLCRCGASRHKPYCDGAHRESGFTASGEPISRDSEPLALRDGPLEIEPVKNGPLLVRGNVELCTGTGRTLWRTTKTALCRCGQSQSKPYCDGTHGKSGFSSE